MPSPPSGTTWNTPFDPPLQLTLQKTSVVQLTGKYSLIRISQVVIQSLASVTVTVCVPAFKAVAIADDSLLSHKYVNGAVPPIGVTVALPSDKPLQLTSDSRLTLQVKISGSVISAMQKLVHLGLPISLIVMICIPADNIVKMPSAFVVVPSV